MHSFSAFSYGPGDTEKWRTDLRKMTKIYKSVQTVPEDQKLPTLLEARDLFRTFSKTFDDWVYKELLPSVKPDEQSYQEQKVAKAVWTALISIADLFPVSYNYKTDKHETSVFAFERDIDKNITKYQRAFNIALKAIEDLIKDRKELGTTQLEAIELLHVGPIQVVVHNQGREKRDMEGALDDELRSIKHATDLIVRAGFPKAVEGLTLHVSFIQTKLIAGHYDHSNDELVLFPLGVGRENNHTFIHECGHRFYYRALPSNARQHWGEVIDQHAVIIEKSDIDHMVDKYVKPYADKHRHTPNRQEIMPIIQREETVEMAAKCIEMSNHMPVFTNDPEEVRKFWLDSDYILGARVNLEEISNYASTDEKEAFAEAFMLYITEGPRSLGPWTLDFFKRISQAGGAKFASMRDRVLERFIARFTLRSE